MTAFPVLVAHTAPGTDPARLRDAACPATALPDQAGSRWVVVDPLPGSADALRAVPGCHNVQTAWAVAVLLDVPEVAPILASLRAAARDTISIEDPDFGPVAYALFETSDAAIAALGC